MGVDDPYLECARQILHFGPRINWWAGVRIDQDHLDRELSVRQMVVLYAIREESASLGQLAQRLFVTPAVVTGIVDRLEKRGYVRREGDLNDRRVVQLVLTENGRDASLAVEGALVALIRQCLQHLSASELATIERGLMLLDRTMRDLERDL